MPSQFESHDLTRKAGEKGEAAPLHPNTRFLYKGLGKGPGPSPLSREGGSAGSSEQVSLRGTTYDAKLYRRINSSRETALPSLRHEVLLTEQEKRMSETEKAKLSEMEKERRKRKNEKEIEKIIGELTEIYKSKKSEVDENFAKKFADIGKRREILQQWSEDQLKQMGLEVTVLQELMNKARRYGLPQDLDENTRQGIKILEGASKQKIELTREIENEQRKYNKGLEIILEVYTNKTNNLSEQLMLLRKGES